jgi:hypothetical protein
VDGQQRIGALVSFVNNEFKLKKTHLDEKDTGYANKTFKELSPEDKNKIWKYSFTFRIILEEVSRDNIVKLFLGLNSTDKSLNPQELRNAEFDGLFLKTAEEIAEYDFWDKYHIFSVDNIRRMADIEFISSILIFFRLGISSEVTQKSINEVYDLFNEKYDEASDDKDIFYKILGEIECLIQRDSTILTYLKKNSHLYSIIVVVYKALSVERGLSEQQKCKLINFYKKYEELEEKEVLEYKSLMSGSTRSKQSRMRRNEILSKIVGV